MAFKLRLRHTGWNPLRRPIFTFERIHTRGNFVIGEQQAKRRLSTETDIGVNPKQVRPLRIGQKLRHAIIARARNQTFTTVQDHLQRHTDLLRFGNEVEQGYGVIVKIFTVMAGGHNDRKHLTKG